MTNTWYATGGLLGVDLTTPTSDAKHKLGTIVHGNGQTEWVYVKATTALTQYDVVAVNGSHEAAPASSTLAAQGYTPASAQVAFTVNYYGWVARRGTGLRVRTAASTVKDSRLLIGTTGNSNGVVGTTSASGSIALNGVVTVATAASAGVKPASVWNAPWFTP